MRKNLWLAWISYRHRGVGLFMVILPTSALFVIVTLLISLEGSTRLFHNAAYEDRIALVVGGKVLFTEAEATRVARLADVAEVAQSLSVDCRSPGPEAERLPCRGVGALYVHFVPLVRIPPPRMEKWVHTRDGVLVSKGLAKRFGLLEGKRSSVKLHDGRLVDFEVIHVADDDLSTMDFLWFHETFANEILGRPNTFDQIWVLAKSASQRPLLLEQVKADLLLGRKTLSIFPGEALVATMMSDAQVMVRVLRIAGLLALLVVTLSTLSLLVLAVHQRRAGYAALVAIGFRRATLVYIVLLESVLLVLPGAAIGSLLAWLYLQAAPLRLSPFATLDVRGTDVAISLGFGAVMALIAASIPARTAHRLDVLSTLAEG